jgi:hypothetical protein
VCRGQHSLYQADPSLREPQAILRKRGICLTQVTTMGCCRGRRSARSWNARWRPVSVHGAPPESGRRKKPLRLPERPSDASSKQGRACSSDTVAWLRPGATTRSWGYLSQADTQLEEFAAGNTHSRRGLQAIGQARQHHEYAAPIALRFLAFAQRHLAFDYLTAAILREAA